MGSVIIYKLCLLVQCFISTVVFGFAWTGVLDDQSIEDTKKKEWNVI